MGAFMDRYNRMKGIGTVPDTVQAEEEFSSSVPASEEKTGAFAERYRKLLDARAADMSHTISEWNAANDTFAHSYGDYGAEELARQADALRTSGESLKQRIKDSGLYDDDTVSALGESVDSWSRVHDIYRRDLDLAASRAEREQATAKLPASSLPVYGQNIAETHHGKESSLEDKILYAQASVDMLESKLENGGAKLPEAADIADGESAHEVRAQLKEKKKELERLRAEYAERENTKWRESVGLSNSSHVPSSPSEDVRTVISSQSDYFDPNDNKDPFGNDTRPAVNTVNAVARAGDRVKEAGDLTMAAFNAGMDRSVSGIGDAVITAYKTAEATAQRLAGINQRPELKEYSPAAAEKKKSLGELLGDAAVAGNRAGNNYLLSGDTLTDRSEKDTVMQDYLYRRENQSLGKAGDIIADLAENFGYQMPNMLLTHGLGATGLASSALTAATFGSGSYVSNRREMLEEGYTPAQADLYGTMGFFIEGVGESLLGDAFGTVPAIGRKLGLSLIDNISNPIVRTLTVYLAESGEEGLEEVAQGILEASAKSLITGEDFTLDAREVAYEGILGAISGGMLGAIGLGQRLRSAGRVHAADVDFVNTLSVNADSVENAAEAKAVIESLEKQRAAISKMTDETTGLEDTARRVKYLDTALEAMSETLKEKFALDTKVTPQGGYEVKDNRRPVERAKDSLVSDGGRVSTVDEALELARRADGADSAAEAIVALEIQRQRLAESAGRGFAAKYNDRRLLDAEIKLRDRFGIENTEFSAPFGGKNAEAYTGRTRYSITDIVGEESGKNYGVGVYLDSNALDGLDEAERRREMRRFVVNELAGESFTAYNGNTPTEITFARASDKMLNKQGKKKKVLRELYNKNNYNDVKQESVMLADELVEASSYDSSRPSNYSHGWIDNYGQNDWENRKVYVKEKNGAVWEATLNVANTADGRKILYDIDKIKKVEGPIKSGPATTNSIISQNNTAVNSQYTQKNENDSKTVESASSDLRAENDGAADFEESRNFADTAGEDIGDAAEVGVNPQNTAENGTNAAENGANAAENGANAAENGANAAENGTNAAENGANAAENGTNTAENDTNDITAASNEADFAVDREGSDGGDAVDAFSDEALERGDFVPTEHGSAWATNEATRTGRDSGASPAQQAAAEELSRILDRRVLFFRSGDTSVNGYFKDGAIYVNAASGRTVASIVASEMTHALESTSDYGALRELAIRELSREKNMSIDELRAQKKETYAAHGEELDAAGVDFELCEEYVGTYLFKDVSQIRRAAAYKPSLVNRIISFLDGIIRRLTGREHAVSSRILSDMRYARHLWGQAVREVRASGTEDGTAARHSFAGRNAQNEITERYRTAVDNVLNMQNTTADNLIIGYTPKLMREMGMPSLPMVIGTGHVYSIAKTAEEAKQDGNYHKGVHYHGLGESAVKNIYTALCDPVMVIASKDVNPNAAPMRSTHSIVAIIDVGKSSQSLLLPVEITAERTVNGDQMDVNVLSSAYNKDVSALVKEAIALENSGDIGIYYAKKEAAALVPAGVQFPIRIQGSTASDTIIHRLNEKVNMQISDATQSRQFKRWFGDWQNHPESASKIVNEDGTPKVVYHQTGADFTVFNTDNPVAGKNDSDTPTGIFFKTTDEDIGIGGSKQMAVYLNARNVLEFENRTEAHRYWMDRVPGYAELQARYDSVDEAYNSQYEEAEAAGDLWYEQHYDELVSGEISDDEAMQIMDGPLDEILTKWKSETEPIAVAQKKLITDYMNRSPFDGMHLLYDGSRNGVDVETYIVFDSAQAKSATDNIGTYDPGNKDIRYSFEDSGAEQDAFHRRHQEELESYTAAAERARRNEMWDERRAAENEANDRLDALAGGGAPEDVLYDSAQVERGNIERENVRPREATMTQEEASAHREEVSRTERSVPEEELYAAAEEARRFLEDARTAEKPKWFESLKESATPAEQIRADGNRRNSKLGEYIEEHGTDSEDVSASDFAEAAVREIWTGAPASEGLDPELEEFLNEDPKDELDRHVREFLEKQKSRIAVEADAVRDAKRIDRSPYRLIYANDTVERQAQMSAASRMISEMIRKQSIPAAEVTFARQIAAGEQHASNIPTNMDEERVITLSHLYLTIKRANSAEPATALQKLGIKIAYPLVTDYRDAPMLRSWEKELYHARKSISEIIAEFDMTDGEIGDAVSIARGHHTIEDYRGYSNRQRYAISELADAYNLVGTLVNGGGIPRQRALTREKFSETLRPILSGIEGAKKRSALRITANTMIRNNLAIFGDVKGAEINRLLFRPVQENEAERMRFVNRHIDEFTETFGAVTAEESAAVQKLIEAGADIAETSRFSTLGELIDSTNDKLRTAEARAESLEAENEIRSTEKTRKAVKKAQERLTLLETQLEAYSYVSDSGVDFDRAIRMADYLRGKYAEFYEATNDFLVVHGYNPIGFIRNYAPHMQEKQMDELSSVLKRFGFTDEVGELPTEIAGRTKDFKPGKKWNPHHQKRRGNNTVYDAIAGYNRYIRYMSEMFYHTDDIQKLRQFNQEIRAYFTSEEIQREIDAIYHEMWKDEKTEEEGNEKIEALLARAKDTNLSPYVAALDNYTNIIAGKQTAGDRAMETDLGRKTLNAGERLERRFTAAAIVGNLSSAIAQTVQIPAVMAECGYANFARAVKDVFTRELNKKADFDSRSVFITGKRGTKRLSTKLSGVDLFADTAVNKVGPFIFEAVDDAMSRIIVRTKYMQLIGENVNSDSALALADEFADSVVGSRIKGAKPIAFCNKNFVWKLLTTFQLEVANSWAHIDQDLPATVRRINAQEGKKAAVRYTAALIAKYVLSAFFLNRLTDELYGQTPVPFDIAGYVIDSISAGSGMSTNTYLRTVIDNAFEKLLKTRPFDTAAPDEDEEFNAGKSVSALAEGFIGDMPFAQNALGILGIGDARLPLPRVWSDSMTSAFGKITSDDRDTAAKGWRQIGSAALSNAATWIPFGNQLNKSLRGIYTVARKGSYDYSGRLQYPAGDSVLEKGAAVLFGKSAFNSNADFWDGDSRALSDKATAAYKVLLGSGMKQMQAYRLVEKLTSVAGDSKDNGDGGIVEGEGFDALGSRYFDEDENAVNTAGMNSFESIAAKYLSDGEEDDGDAEDPSDTSVRKIDRQIEIINSAPGLTDDQKYDVFAAVCASTKMTDVMAVLDRAGADRGDVYDLISSIAAARATEDDPRPAAGLIRNSSLSDEEKALVYYATAATKKERQVQRELDSLGEDSAAVWEMLDAYAEERKNTDDEERLKKARSALRDSEITAKGKAEAYYLLCATKKEREFMDKVGGDFDMGEVSDVLSRIRDCEKQGEKAGVLAASSGLTSHEKRVMYLDYICTDTERDAKEKALETVEAAGGDIDLYLKARTALTNVTWEKGETLGKSYAYKTALDKLTRNTRLRFALYEAFGVSEKIW